MSKNLFRLNSLPNLLDLKPLYARMLVLACSALLAALLLLVFRSGLQNIEERLGALGWVLTADDSLEQRITLVTIDERSLSEVGPWPWSRQTLADLSQAITDAGAQLQLHDIVYSEPREGDDALLAALQAANGPVLSQPVLNSDSAVSRGTMTHSVSGVSCASGLPRSSSYLAPHALFSGIPKGHITPVIDSDGAIRKAPPLICVDGQAYPSLVLSALFQAINSDSWEVELNSGDNLLAAEQVLRLPAYPGLEIPLDADGNLRISYRASPDSFMAVSAADVLAGRIEADMFDNTWVLIGATALGMGDIVPTPYSGATPGVELQARMLASLLDSDIPYTPQIASFLLAALCLGFALLTLRLASAGDRWVAYGLPVAALTLPLLALAVHLQLLVTANLWLGWMYPALFGLVAASALLLLEQRRVRSERHRVFGNLNSYLPRDFARQIAFSLPSSTIKAQRSEVTLLSADLRNFSAFSEVRPADESAALLHYFFVRATALIEKYGGQVQEFRGDGLLAVWDGQGCGPAEQAYAAAREMQAALPDEILTQHAPNGLEPLALGIGIEQGPVLMGAMGPAHRRTHTLLGDTVTITLRIQELTADTAQSILIGECAARQLPEAGLQSQGSYLLKGLRTPHTLYAPAPPAAGAGSAGNGKPDLKVLSGGRS
jgi:CHASE2 domain-containing sensor protein/class 3 adenylate cyclase